jgi:hypothetical protein
MKKYDFINLIMKIRNQFIVMTLNFYFMFLGVGGGGEIGQEGVLLFNFLEPGETGWSTRPMAG